MLNDQRDYTDAYGVRRVLVPLADCDCCLAGTLKGQDGTTGEPWRMTYWLPKAAVTLTDPRRSAPAA